MVHVSEHHLKIDNSRSLEVHIKEGNIFTGKTFASCSGGEN